MLIFLVLFSFFFNSPIILQRLYIWPVLWLVVRFLLFVCFPQDGTSVLSSYEDGILSHLRTLNCCQASTCILKRKTYSLFKKWFTFSYHFPLREQKRRNFIEEE